MNPSHASSKISKKDRLQARLRAKRTKLFDYDHILRRSPDFRCRHCGRDVSGEAIISGVQNRNHCPWCLYSQHLDLSRAGDRLSACKAEMKPIGLTCKSGRKKFPTENLGELMLVHICTQCKHISVNRIAADDDSQMILALLLADPAPDFDPVRGLAMKKIQLLGPADEAMVKAQLFGKHHRMNT